ncbi:MAG: NAD(P)/FAD-dependent oxidoreductase [Acidimicrobiales bacterium]|nr:NAD(P)/FAD-dependent oxidoreductase [Hyphomonadaceae bacterium]RZV44268.1 MAG: NAD(P)/FAD-dependent oxidoreductase [Acidimicrobiales bacterium]
MGRALVPEKIECIIAGAGVIGLAIGKTLADAGRQVMVLEAEDAYGTLTSARNSEVIHAGLYYPTGSLKAKTCVAGRRMLYEYLTSRHVPHQKTGKLIVAQDEAELAQLEHLLARGKANGVEGLSLINASDARKLETSITCIGALYSEETGIIDSHAYMQALEADIEAGGGMVVTNAPIIYGKATQEDVRLEIGGADPVSLDAQIFINATGYSAPALSHKIKGISESTIPESRLCKGNYFTLSARAPFSRLIYPAPAEHGLGVHLTLDMGGQARFGPDTEWLEEVDYNVDPARCVHFYDEIRRYWPEIRDETLHPGYSGIRPKIAIGGELYPDFMIKSPADHNAPIVALYGIESPGLTASLAIGEIVRDTLPFD